MLRLTRMAASSAVLRRKTFARAAFFALRALAVRNSNVQIGLSDEAARAAMALVAGGLRELEAVNICNRLVCLL